MKAVFEEINGDYAVFIVDDAENPYHLSKSELPDGTISGDVFEVEIDSNKHLKLLEKLPEERQRREASAKSKREQLLKRNKNN